MAQCPSCKFENIPQYQTCVRCGSILPGSAIPVGVEPPRAGKLEKALRLAAVIRTANRFAGVFANGTVWAWQKFFSLFQLSFFRLEIRSADLTILTTFWTGILPGLPQWYIGRTPHDKIFFFGWIALLFLTLLTFGLPLSGFLLGLLLAWHLSSIIDRVIITSVKNSDRLFQFSLMTMMAVCLFYLPISALCWNHLGIQRINGTAGPLRSGDSLLYTWSRHTIQPRVGDVVLYQAPQVQYQLERDRVYRLGGPMFDRVLALEGQTVTWKEGTLTIDGESSQPFIAVVHPPDSTFVVPEGQCYIVPGVAFSPGVAQRLAMPTDASTWQAMGLVPYESVYGTVWGARRSLFRFVDLRPQNPVGD